MAPIIQTMKVQNGYPRQYQSANPAFSATNNQAEQPAFSATNAAATQADAIVQSNPLLNAATSAPSNPLAFLGQGVLALGALFGINDLINNPLLTKDYDSTIFKKIETWGDKVAQKETTKTIGNFLGKFKNSIKDVVKKSEVLRTIAYKNSLGGSNVMSQAAGSKGHLASRALEVMKRYKAETGFTGFDAILAKAEKESYLYYDEIINTIKNSGVNLKQVLVERPTWSLKLLKNKSSLQEILNKDILIQNYKGAGKTLGQRLSGYMMRGTECLTNGIFGGKGQMLFQALMVAQSLNEASKAEKGEKFSTFMASFSELMMFMVTMGVQQRVVNKLAGLKYIGFKNKDIKTYKEAIKLANEAAKNKDFATHAANVLKATNLRKIAADSLTWYQKPIKWIGDIISFGRVKETIKPLKNGIVSNALSKVWYGLKVGTGYAGRVALIMAVVIPIFAGIAKKASYAIFGKPTKTLEREKQKELEEKQKMEEEAKAAETKAPEPQKPQVAQTQQVQPTSSVQQPRPVGNLVEKMMNISNAGQVQPQISSQPIAAQPVYPQYQQYSQPQGYPQYQQPIFQQYPQQAYPQYPQQPMYQQYPAQQQIAAAPVSQPQQAPDAIVKRTYIPNPVLGVEKTQKISDSNITAVNNVMRQADWAEAQASKFL